MLAELYHLRRDDRHAVGLMGIIGKIFLMVIFRHVELRERRDLGDDGIRPQTRLGQFADDRLGVRALRFVVEEDCRAVLRPHVRALTVERGRVMDGEEDRQQVAERQHGGVEGHLHGFRVTGIAGADGLVGRIFNPSA